MSHQVIRLMCYLRAFFQNLFCLYQNSIYEVFRWKKYVPSAQTRHHLEGHQLHKRWPKGQLETIRNQSIPHKPDFVKLTYLIGGLEHLDYFPFHIWDVILPIDELIFFKMVETTNQWLNQEKWKIFHVIWLFWICLIYIYGRYLQSIGSCCMAIDGKPMVSALENDRQMVLIRGFSLIFLCRKGCHGLLQMRRCRPLKLTQYVQVMH